MKISVEDYLVMSQPTGGQPRPPTREEAKRSEQIARKVGQERVWECENKHPEATKAAQSQLGDVGAMVQQMMGGSAQEAQQRMAGAAGTTEAPGKQPTVADDVAGELPEAKTAVRDIDWTVVGASLSASGKPAFEAAMAALAKGMQQAGGRFRLDLYMDERYDDVAVESYGPARLQLVESTLVAVGPGLTLQVGKAKRDKDPRLEIVRE